MYCACAVSAGGGLGAGLENALLLSGWFQVSNFCFTFNLSQKGFQIFIADFKRCLLGEMPPFSALLCLKTKELLPKDEARPAELISHHVRLSSEIPAQKHQSPGTFSELAYALTAAATCCQKLLST